MLLIGEFGSQLLLNDSRLNSLHDGAIIPDLHGSKRPYIREINFAELLLDLKTERTFSCH